VTGDYRSMRAGLPTQVVELVDAFRNPITQIEFRYLLAVVAGLAAGDDPLEYVARMRVSRGPAHHGLLMLAR